MFVMDLLHAGRTSCEETLYGRYTGAVLGGRCSPVSERRYQDQLVSAGCMGGEGSANKQRLATDCTAECAEVFLEFCAPHLHTPLLVAMPASIRSRQCVVEKIDVGACHNFCLNVFSDADCHPRFEAQADDAARYGAFLRLCQGNAGGH